MPMLPDHLPNGGVNGNLSILQLPLPVADDKIAAKLEKCIRQNDIAGAGRLLEKHRGVEAFDAEMLEFFIRIMHAFLGRRFSEFQALARLAKKAAARVRLEGPANPAYGYCFEAEILSAIVLREWGRAMRIYLGGVPADAADASLGSPEFEIHEEVRTRYPVLILQKATLYCFGIHEDGAHAYKDLLELADLMPEYLQGVSEITDEFEIALSFLKTLSITLENDCDFDDGHWARALMHDRFIPVALKCLGSVSDKPAASGVRMSFVSIFVKRSLEDPAVFETLWRIIVRTRALVMNSADAEAREAAREELWATAAVILNAEPSVLRMMARSLKETPLAADASTSGLIDALCAAKDDAAVLFVADQAAERLRADPTNLAAGFVLSTAVRTAASINQVCGAIEEVRPTTQELQSNPFIAYARLLNEFTRGTGAELNQAAVLVVEGLEAAGRIQLVSMISSTAGKILMVQGLRELAEKRAWKTIAAAARFAQFPQHWSSPAASLINCAEGYNFARFALETPEDEDYASQDSPPSNFEIIERVDALKALPVPRGAMERVLRLEKALSVIVASFPYNFKDGRQLWRDFGGEAGTGISPNELERLEACDRDVIREVLARWTEDMEKAWRAALAEGVDLTVDPDRFDSEMDDEVDDDDSDELDVDDEHLKQALSLKIAVEESLGEIVDFDFDFSAVDAPDELEDFIMLVRPKADPGRLLFVSGFPLLRALFMKDDFERLMSGEKVNRPFIVTMEVPADLLESETGRRTLRRLVLMHLFAMENVCAADRRRTFFLEGSLLMTDTRFSNWKAFPTKRLLAVAHGNPDDPDYADESTGWLSVEGDRLMPVVEVLLLTEAEFKLFDRFGVRAVLGALPLDLLRLRRQRRASAVDIYDFRKPAGRRPAPVKLPPALRSLTCWAARPIMEGAAPCGGFFFAKPDLEDDSGWIFAVKGAPVTDYVRLPLADVLAVLPAALPHVVEGRGQRFAPSADGLGFTEIPTEDSEIFEADEVDRALFSDDEA